MSIRLKQMHSSCLYWLVMIVLFQFLYWQGREEEACKYMLSWEGVAMKSCKMVVRGDIVGCGVKKTYSVIPKNG